MKFSQLRTVMTLNVWVAGLGYFVDMFDISLFGVVRNSSLRSLLVPSEELLSAGLLIYNSQALGMMFGGILWGVLADQKGRLKVLFGSIILYSIGNLANVFVWNVPSYAVCRFVTGFGLAGELGAAITLVAESLPIEVRGLGTTVVASLGLSGSVAAAIIGQRISWQWSYAIGGILGLLLLVTRFQLKESSLFQNLKSPSGFAGMRLLFKASRIWRYLRCIAIGLPIYFITGILFTFAPELAKNLGVQEPISAGQALLMGGFGLAFGDLLSGLLSQYFASRKRAVAISLLGAMVLAIFYLYLAGLTADQLYFLCFLLGLMGGYWAVLVTMAAEQFGTNLRGVVTTTVPNFIRGSAAAIATSVGLLKPHFGLSTAAVIVGGITFGLAGISLWLMKETFTRDLDFLES